MHFLVDPISVLPKPHRGGAGEPSAPVPTRILFHPTDDIPESTHRPSAEAFPSLWCPSGVGVPLGQFVPA